MTFLEFLAKAKAPNAVVQVRQEAPNGAWLCWDSVGWGNAMFCRLEELFYAGRLRIKPIKHSVVVSKAGWQKVVNDLNKSLDHVQGETITLEWEE